MGVVGFINYFMIFEVMEVIGSWFLIGEVGSSFRLNFFFLVPVCLREKMCH